MHCAPHTHVACAAHQASCSDAPKHAHPLRTATLCTPPPPPPTPMPRGQYAPSGAGCTQHQLSVPSSRRQREGAGEQDQPQRRPLHDEGVGVIFGSPGTPRSRRTTHTHTQLEWPPASTPTWGQPAALRSMGSWASSAAPLPLVGWRRARVGPGEATNNSRTGKISTRGLTYWHRRRNRPPCRAALYVLWALTPDEILAHVGITYFPTK